MLVWWYAYKRKVEHCLRTVSSVNSILPSVFFISHSAGLLGLPASQYASGRCKYYVSTSRASLVGLGRSHQDVLLYYIMSSDTRRRDLGEDADAIFAGSYIIYSPSRRRQRRRLEFASGLNDRVRSIFGRSPARVQPFFAGTVREKPTIHSRTMADGVRYARLYMVAACRSIHVAGKRNCVWFFLSSSALSSPPPRDIRPSLTLLSRYTYVYFTRTHVQRLSSLPPPPAL